MKMKISVSWKEAASHYGWKKHRDLYGYLTDRYGLEIDSGDCHGVDSDFTTSCEGFKVFLRKFGQQKEVQALLTPEVETMTTKRYAAVLIAEAEYLFRLLAEQAERGIDTGGTEYRLRKAKETLKQLAQCPDGQVTQIVGEHRVERAVPLSVLERIPKRLRKYVVLANGEVRGVEPLEAHDRIAIIHPPQPRREPQLSMRFTGKEIVAVHLDALGEQVAQGVQKLLQERNEEEDD